MSTTEQPSKPRRFSFTRIFSNIYPTISTLNLNVDLTPQQADLLLIHQLGPTSSPIAPSLIHQRYKYLTATSFVHAQITPSTTISRQIHGALLKAGIIAAPPDTIDQVDATTCRLSGGTAVPEPVNTLRIDSGFSRRLPMLSVHAQKRLVGLLFHWEEECVRFRLLDAEEREILRAIEEWGHASDCLDGRGSEDGEDEHEGAARQTVNIDLACALQSVRMRRRMLFSRRPSNGGALSSGITQGSVTGHGDELPGYSRR